MLHGGQAVGWAVSALLWPLLSTRLAQASSRRDLGVTRAASGRTQPSTQTRTSVAKAGATAKPRFKVKKDCSLGGKGKLVTVYQIQWREQMTAAKMEEAMTWAGRTGKVSQGRRCLSCGPESWLIQRSMRKEEDPEQGLPGHQ